MRGTAATDGPREVGQPRTAPPPPPVATAVFGTRLSLAQHYAELLAGPGIEHGLLGPRETARIWERHLLNCAVVTDLLPDQTRVVDVGAGAGLPGLALAIRRPDLHVDLVESLLRRVAFLNQVVTALGLHDSVRVVHGRAEDAHVLDLVGVAPWVTARAVAPLDRLARWCLPLLRPGGVLLAMKGESAQQELDTHRTAIRGYGGTSARVIRCGADRQGRSTIGMSPTVVVAIRRGGAPTRTRKDGR